MVVAGSLGKTNRLDKLDPYTHEINNTWWEKKCLKVETSDLISIMSNGGFFCMFSTFGWDFSFNSCVTYWCCRRIPKKKGKKLPQGSCEDIFEGTGLWEFSVKAFQNYSSSSSLNTRSSVACWTEWIPLRYFSAVWLIPVISSPSYNNNSILCCFEQAVDPQRPDECVVTVGWSADHLRGADFWFPLVCLAGGCLWAWHTRTDAANLPNPSVIFGLFTDAAHRFLTLAKQEKWEKRPERWQLISTR